MLELQWGHYVSSVSGAAGQCFNQCFRTKNSHISLKDITGLELFRPTSKGLNFRVKNFHEVRALAFRGCDG